MEYTEEIIDNEWVAISDSQWEIPFERLEIKRDRIKGCGAQGSTYHGQFNDIPVAIKEVTDPSLVQIRHLKELNHRNLLKFMGISQNCDRYYIIMELGSSLTLDDIIHRESPTSFLILADYAAQIANGMEYLHSKQIIHRDLKPSNILIHYGVIKIIDFGSHKQLDHSHDTSVSEVGTAPYMAPEVMKLQPYSYPADVWSYGAVLWEIFTGIRPYNDRNQHEVIWLVGKHNATLPIPASFPQTYAEIIRTCLDPNPSRRCTFSQICSYQGKAIGDIERFPIMSWVALQNTWKQTIRTERTSASQLDNQAKEIRLKEETLEKMMQKNCNFFLKMQECWMDLQRERQALKRERRDL